MRHKHSIRGGNPNAATSVRDAYGFEVVANACYLQLLASQGCVSVHAISTRLHRSRRICTVCIISMHQSGRRKKWSVLNDGMPFWLTLRPCIRKMPLTSKNTNKQHGTTTVSCWLDPRQGLLFRQEKGAPLQQLEQACQGWAPEDRGASTELNDWQHQLRSLVQAGIPMVTGSYHIDLRVTNSA